VSYFPSRDNYDEFYGFIIRVVNIAFEKFATSVQALLVKHLRKFGDKPAEWYEEWWTGAFHHLEEGLVGRCPVVMHLR
jgi:hypothetical protein